METPRSTWNKRRGFSLLELSVIISVASIATLGLLAWTQPEQVSDAQKYVQTRTKMKQISEAIYNFRSNRERLPCPADPYQRADDTRDASGGTDDYVNAFGLEDLDTETEVSGTITRGVDCPNNVGAVPVYSLGLDSSFMEDAWQRRFTYQVSDNLCGQDQGTNGTPALSIEESVARGCTPQDYNDRVGDITVVDGSNNTITQKAAYVLVSHGPNGKGAFLPSGIKVSGASSGEATNSDNSGSNQDKFVKSVRTASFDDIVLFKTRKTIERLRRNREKNRLSVSDCATNSTTLTSLNKTDLDAMDTHITGLQVQSGAQTLNTGQEVVLSILMNIQDECLDLYGNAARTGSRVSGWNGPVCPGGGTYDAATNSCSCADGSWDDDCTIPE